MGSKGSGGGSNQMGFQATTSTYSPNPEAMAAYRNAIGMAENVAQIPYEQYQGQMVAGFTPDQLAAFQGTREMQGMAQPYINAAAGAVNRSMMMADPRNFTPAALQQYYNPYQQNVIESSKRMMAQQNAQQQADLTARAIQQGAYGGDRSGVARAALMGQQALANQQVLSGLQQQGYQQAVGQYNQQQQQAIGAAQQGAYSLGQLGLQGQQAALQGIQALLGTGGMQQNLAQQQLSAAYNQWLQERAYPYQQANFYSGIVSGIAPNMGGTTNTMGFGTGSQQTQQAQGGGGGAGMLTSALSFLPMLMGISDKDDKTDIKYLGKDKSGEKLYSYRYKGDPKSYPKVVGPMAQDIEKHSPERVHEFGGHKIVEGLGHLSPSQRQGFADGGYSSIYSSPTVDQTAYQQSPYQANQALDPGFKTGLEAVIDPAMANKIAESRWVTQHPDDGQSQSQEAINEQMQYRNPDFNLFPYFQDGKQSQSPFDGNAQPDQMYADGGAVDGGGDFSSLIKSKTPFGAANSYIEALPITPGRAHIPEPPKMNWLPGLPGGGMQGGGGGSGGGGGEGMKMPKLPKTGGSKAASAGAASPESSAAKPESAATDAAPEAAASAPAPDMGAAAAPAPMADAGFGDLGGGLGLDNLFSGLGGIFGGFSHGGRVHMAAGGAGGDGAAGGIGSSEFAGALGPGVGAIPGVIGEEGSGTLGSLAPKIQLAPTHGPMGDMGYKGWLDRAMAIDPGPQLTPEQQGMPSLPDPKTQSNRPWLPGETQSQVIGNQNPGLDPLMMMMAGGKGATGLALGAMLGQQNAANSAREMQATAQAKRASILASPRDVGGYFQKLGSNVVNPRTGLFNIDYTGAYYVPHYKQGGRVKRENGGFNYAPSMQLYYDLINSGKMTPQAAAGYAGNFSYEASGRGQNQLNPGAIEGGVPFNKAGLGYAQWTNARRGPEGRHTDFLNYAKDVGKPWSSHEANLGYFNKERVENPFVSRADERVQSQPTIPAAATSVMRDYERPGAAEAARSLPQRIGMSEHIGNIAQAGNPFQGQALAEQSYRASLPEPIVDPGSDVVAADPVDTTTGGDFADGGRVAMQRGGGLDERTAALANRAMSYFLGKGYSKAAAAGIVGNLIHESGGRLNPAAHGDLDLGPARSAWGIGQWREGRFRNLQNFARAIGRDWRDFDTQLAFVDRELKSDYRNAHRGISSARTPQEAAAQMMMYYEIPGHRVTGVPSTYSGWSDRARYASMLGGQDYRPSAVAGYGAPSSAPVRTLEVRPLTGERAVSAYDTKPAVAAPASPYAGSVLNRINPADPSGPLLGQPKTAPATAPVVPQKGFSFANLSPVSSAQAADMNVFPEDDKGRSFGDVGARMHGMTQKFAYAPGVYETDDIKTAFGENARRGDMPGDVPYAVTMAGAPMGPWDDGKGFSEAVVSSDEKARPKPSTEARPTQPAASGNGPYWGDYRDYEPWASDPIGAAFDRIVGDTPHSTHKGASMWDVGGGETAPASLGDLFKQYGGRVNMADGGDPLAKIDPEMFSGEPMLDQPAGFDPAVVAPPEETSDVPESRVVATDMPERQAPARQQGFGGLRSPITGQPMTFGPLSQAMLAAGLGMMASDRVNPLQAIGEGGLRGLEYYQSAQAGERAGEMEQLKLQQMREQMAQDRAFRERLGQFAGNAPRPVGSIKPSRAASAGEPEVVAGDTTRSKIEALMQQRNNLISNLGPYATSPAAKSQLAMQVSNIDAQIKNLQYRTPEEAAQIYAEKQARAQEEMTKRQSAIVEKKQLEKELAAERKAAESAETALPDLYDVAKTMKEIKPGVYTPKLAEASRYMPEWLREFTGTQGLAAGMQKITKENMTNLFDQLKMIGGQIRVAEMENLKKTLADPSLEPEAVQGILARGIAIAENAKKFDEYKDEWLNNNPNYTPQDYYSMRAKWLREHPVGELKKQKESELGIAGTEKKSSSVKPTLEQINRSLQLRGVQ